MHAGAGGSGYDYPSRTVIDHNVTRLRVFGERFGKYRSAGVSALARGVCYFDSVSDPTDNRSGGLDSGIDEVLHEVRRADLVRIARAVSCGTSFEFILEIYW